MKVITERTLIRDVAERWYKRYPDGLHDDGRRYRELDALNKKTATAADVNAIIGVGGWAGPWECNECGESRTVLAQLGRGDEYEGRIFVCRACLRGALAAIEATA